MDDDCPRDVVGEAVVTKGHKESSSNKNHDRGGCKSSGYGKNHIDKQQCGGVRKEHGRGMLESSPDNKLDGEKVAGSEIGKEVESAEKGNQHSEPSNSGSSMEIEDTYGGTQVNISDDTGRGFAMSSDRPYSSLANRWSTGSSHGSGYRATNLEEPFAGHMRERSGSLGYVPYSNAVEDPFRRESEIRSKVRLYGQQDADPLRSNYPVGQNSPSGQIGSYSSAYPHGHHGSAAESSSYRMNTSAMQRYAPRLDELNHSRMGVLRSEPSLGYDPHMFSSSSSSTFDPRAPRPGQHGGYMGFAPGPHQSYSNQNSAGWLNE